jgi:TPR repeat protein
MGGHSASKYSHGVIYINGWGVPQDYKEAVKWYRLAALQDDTDVQSILGSMYHKAKGVVADFVLAQMWYSIAAANGNNRMKLEAITKDMT